MSASETSQLALNDIQGFILRGYHMQSVRHFILRINDVSAAKDLLVKTTDINADFLQITTAEPWLQGKPDYCLNIGITYAGLKQLVNTDGVNFPGVNYNAPKEQRSVFKQGSAAAAQRVGDTGESAPENWEGELGTDNAQLIFSLYSISEEALKQQSKRLTDGFADNNAFEVLHQFDGSAFADDKIHFGYRDGISQPQIIGGPAKPLADDQKEVPAWNFVLQQTEEATYKIETEQEKKLLVNGSFAAFRVLEQDVQAFDSYLNDKDHINKITPERLAAKMCGRWRNGNPLVLDPDGDTPVEAEEINDFEYQNADPKGFRCPISSHLRRTNPRNQVVKGNATGESSTRHRIVRRGMPYGPLYNPDNKNDGINRGLLGMFICSDLAEQFEFIMGHWVQTGNFATRAPAGKDPLLGNNNSQDSIFEIPQKEEETLTLKGFTQFIKTKGSAYVFLPSISALKYIAESSI